MKSIYFDDYNSYSDFHLLLNSKEIEAPLVKNIDVELEGGDGKIDFTEYFGDVHYENRKLSFEFSTIEPQEDFMTIFSMLQNTLHGRRMKIVLDDDKDFYYYGRVEVDKWKSNKRIGKITINVDCEPYKYKKSVTIISDVVNIKKSILCVNLRKNVIPRITLSGKATVKFGNYSSSMNAGSNRDTNIVFVKGQNVLTITPVSSPINVSIEYQERGL